MFGEEGRIEAYSEGEEGLPWCLEKDEERSAVRERRAFRGV